MQRQNSVFHQITKHIPWAVFDRSVASHGADFRVRRLRTRDQFLALLYGQLAGAVSLREIENGMRSCAHLLYHAGARPVSRSTLADANQTRAFDVYADLFMAMARCARPGLRRKLRDAVRLIDATKVKLSGLSEDWARFSRHHCSAKIHVVYDPHADLPMRADITPDNVNDITAAKITPITPGMTYVFDKAYCDFKWWSELDALGCRFVTRLKSHTKLAVNTKLPVAKGGDIISDHIGHLPERLKACRKNPFTDPVREIIVQRDNKETIRLVTNDLDAPAQEIADLYKQRWEIELFFKWIKQNLKIKRFLGTSENAVKIQIYVALIAFIVLGQAHRAQRAVAGKQAFARLARLNIMQRRCVNALTEPPQTNPPNSNQITMELRPC